MPVALHERREDGSWTQIDAAVTNADGRVAALGGESGIDAGLYRLVFDTADYAQQPFFDDVTVTFRVAQDDDYLHIPLLLSPYGYSVYRGS